MEQKETKDNLLDRIAGKVATELSGMFKKQIKLETAKLENGLTVEIEEDEIYLITEEGERVPAPVGEHTLEDGKVVVVAEEGKIAEIKEKEVEMEKDEKMEFASKEEVAELKKEVAELKSMMQPKEEEMAKVEEPKKEELSKVEEPVQKVTHSPEKETKKVKQNFAKIGGTTKQRVFNRIANLK